MSFINKVVIVTGAASGMGAAISLSFAKLQANLCLVDINETDLHRVGEQCQKLSENKVLEVIADLRSDEDIDNVVQCTLENLEKIDVLVNCAGIYKPTNLQDVDVIENFDKIIAINLRSVVVMTKKALPALIENKGCVINISSVSSAVILLNSLIYSLAKAGVTKFTKCAALELAGLGVRVNCISPGAVKTNIYLNAGFNPAVEQSFWDMIAEKTPMKQCVKIENIAELAVYLASDKAASITGSDFVVDAGMSLGAVEDK